MSDITPSEPWLTNLFAYGQDGTLDTPPPKPRQNAKTSASIPATPPTIRNASRELAADVIQSSQKFITQFASPRQGETIGAANLPSGRDYEAKDTLGGGCTLVRGDAASVDKDERPLGAWEMIRLAAASADAMEEVAANPAQSKVKFDLPRRAPASAASASEVRSKKKTDEITRRTAIISSFLTTPTPTTDPAPATEPPTPAKPDPFAVPSNTSRSRNPPVASSPYLFGGVQPKRYGSAGYGKPHALAVQEWIESLASASERRVALIGKITARFGPESSGLLAGGAGAGKGEHFLPRPMARKRNGSDEVVVAPYILPQVRGVAGAPVHVFVDYSNIRVGFLTTIASRCKLGPEVRTGHVEMDFPALHLILLRGRNMTTGFVATSKSANQRALGMGGSIDRQVGEAGPMGYDVVVLERRVVDVSEGEKSDGNVSTGRKSDGGGSTASRKRGRRGSGWESGNTSGGNTSGNGKSRSPAKDPQQKRHKERFVDEIIQARMSDAILDHGLPSASSSGKVEAPTVILASGDGNQAEYSKGFLPKLENAIKFGWKVEVVSFKSSLSGRFRQLRKDLPERVRIVLLDEFLEELVGDYD